MDKIKKYLELCEKHEDQISIFEQPWWLDIVCGRGRWDVLLAYNNKNDIIGSMPIHSLQTGKIIMPPLTQTLGLTTFKKDFKSYHEQIEFENKIQIDFLEELKTFKSFNYRFKATTNNLLPWHWKGYRLHVRYTYVIDNSSLKDIESTFSKSRRRNVKNAISKGVQIRTNPQNAAFLLESLTEKTYLRQGKSIPYNKALIQKIVDNCISRNRGTVLIAYVENKAIAGALYINDSKTLFQLITGIDSNYGKLNAMDLVITEGIRLAIKNNLIFDFEGSMINGIEYYFRSFGAKQKIYINAVRNNSVSSIIRKSLSDLWHNSIKFRH